MRTYNLFPKPLPILMIWIIFLAEARAQSKIPSYRPDKLADEHATIQYPIGDTDEAVGYFNGRIYFPWTPVCRIFAKSKAVGTGILIGKSDVLTAASLVHELYNKSPLEIIPGYDKYKYGERKQFGYTNVKRFFVHPNYREAGDAFDIAIIKTTTNIGEEAGWLGISAANDNELQTTVYVTGYPKDILKGQRLYLYSTKFSQITSNRLIYLFETNRGMSGAGILLIPREDPEFYIVAVHTGGPNFKPMINCGTRITQEILSWIIKIREE